MGVLLEESFDEEKTIEHFGFIVQRYFQQLRSATLSKSSKAYEAVSHKKIRITICLGAVSQHSTHSIHRSVLKELTN